MQLLKMIGKGSFGKVLLVRKKDDNQIFAMKILKKEHIIKKKEVAHTLAEQKVLRKINHPFLVGLRYSFQTSEKLYLVVDYAGGQLTEA